MPQNITSMWISDRLCGLNDVIALLCGAGGRYAWNRKKRSLHKDVVSAAHIGGFSVCGPHWGYLFVERNRRRDPSNILSVAIKVVEDGLQHAGIIPNDGWADVASITPEFVVGKRPGVMVFSSDAEISRSVMRSIWGSFCGCDRGES